MPLLLCEPTVSPASPVYSSSSSSSSGVCPPHTADHGPPNPRYGWPGSVCKSPVFLPLDDPCHFIPPRPDSPPASSRPRDPTWLTHCGSFVPVGPYPSTTVGAQPGYCRSPPPSPPLPLSAPPAARLPAPRPFQLRSVPPKPVCAPKTLPVPPVLSNRIRQRFLDNTVNKQLSKPAESCMKLPRRKKRTPDGGVPADDCTEAVAV